MATILLAWELGSGWGHVARLGGFSGLGDRGHRVVVATRGGRRIGGFFGTNVQFVQAPELRTSKSNPIPRPCSFAQLLYNIGFADCEALAAAVDRWSTLFRQIQPDLVIADHSPTAQLSLRGMSTQRVLVGTGFTVPHPEYPFRNLRTWRDIGSQELLSFEGQLAENVNSVLAARNRPHLQCMADLYRDHSGLFLQTYRELDPYQRDDAQYRGIGPAAPGDAPQWPDAPGERVFAYLRPFRAFEALLRHLAKSKLPTIVVSSGLPPGTVEKFQTATLKIERRPLDMKRVALEADLAILNGGHGTTAAMLLGGTPILQIPVSLERTLNAHHAKLVGAAIVCPPDNPRAIINSLEEMLSGKEWRDGAERFADRYAAVDPTIVGQEMLDEVEQLLNHAPPSFSPALTTRAFTTSGSNGSRTSRADMEHFVRGLSAPLRAHASPGAARVTLGATAAQHDDASAGLEGFARPLWGLAPLAAGGGKLDDAEQILNGLTNGTDPLHPEYWGTPKDNDQRFVELAAIAVTLCLAPDTFWRPLSSQAKTNLRVYLRTVNDRKLPDSNWLFFRVMVNLALKRLEDELNLEQISTDMNRLDSFYLGDGWYSDGPTEQRDYYVAFAMHFYGLLYSVWARDFDLQGCSRLQERASLFAHHFVHWFGADGSSIPFGRSLTYRFAQGAFWGALAFADVEAYPWGVIKGLHLRHLRWWLNQPIFGDTRLLTIGYAYPNFNIAEGYISPASPYWAFKIFLPLALPEAHPFWSADEEPLPDLPAIVRQPQPRFIICRDRESDHVQALSGGQWATWKPRHVAEKYAKFCYSNRFGFSVPSAAEGLQAGAYDNTLALSEDGTYFRVRREVATCEVADGYIVSDWQPWQDVFVRTWLVPAGGWTVRVHQIRTDRSLQSAEGGFAIERTEGLQVSDDKRRRFALGRAMARSRGISVIFDLLENRRGRVVRSDPNTNLLFPRAVIPSLIGRHVKGNHLLAAAVFASPKHVPIPKQPVCTITRSEVKIADSNSKLVLELELSLGDPG